MNVEEKMDAMDQVMKIYLPTFRHYHDLASEEVWLACRRASEENNTERLILLASAADSVALTSYCRMLAMLDSLATPASQREATLKFHLDGFRECLLLQTSEFDRILSEHGR